MAKTFVYEGQEVKLTGRVAQRAIGKSEAKKIHELVEITPVEDESWKKWIDRSQLYEVQENK